MILRSHRRRVAAFAVFLFLGYLGLLVRLFYIQVRQADHWAAQSRHMRTIKIPRPRGTITDRNGNRLALSMPVQSLFADPAIIEDRDAAAAALAPILSVEFPALRAMFETPRRFVWVARHLDRAVAERVKALNIRGLAFRQEYRRYYPNGQLAANLLGFVGMDGQGLEGIEFQHDAILAAQAGEKLVLSGLKGLEIPQGDVVVREAEGGDTVELTVDEVIQHLAEKEIHDLYQTWQPKSCFIIVTQPRTGELLACAVRPTFDPNDFGAFPDYTYKNRAITDLYEPGSVFKIVPAAASLEDTRVAPQTCFNCPGFIKLYGITMGCTGIHGDVSLRQIIEKSCNTGIAKVGRLLGPESLYYYIRKFGFGEKSDVDLPGERLGLVRLPKEWSGLSTAAISMGQEIGVTGIQMMDAVCTIANGGLLLQPRVVRRVLSPDGRIVRRDAAVEIRRRVVSEGVAHELANMMSRVVVRGTGTRGRLDLYRAAGKTGTSQKLGAGVAGRYVVSFAGFVPVEEPAVAIYIVVNEPQGEKVSGGKVAAPAFRHLAGKVMLYLGVPPDQVAGAEAVDDRPEDEEPPPPPVRAAVPGRTTPAPTAPPDDPVAMTLDESIAPLPGPAGTGLGTEASPPAVAPGALEDVGSDIGRVIDAAVYDDDGGGQGGPAGSPPPGR